MESINHMHPAVICTLDDLKVIEAIAHRAVPMGVKANVDAPFGFWVTQIAVCHKVCPLALEALYTAPDAEFAADIFGIRAYMHESGQWFTEWRPAHSILLTIERG